MPILTALCLLCAQMATANMTNTVTAGAINKTSLNNRTPLGEKNSNTLPSDEALMVPEGSLPCVDATVKRILMDEAGLGKNIDMIKLAEYSSTGKTAVKLSLNEYKICQERPMAWFDPFSELSGVECVTAVAFLKTTPCMSFKPAGVELTGKGKRPKDMCTCDRHTIGAMYFRGEMSTCCSLRALERRPLDAHVPVLRVRLPISAALSCRTVKTKKLEKSRAAPFRKFSSSPRDPLYSLTLTPCLVLSDRDSYRLTGELVSRSDHSEA